MAKLKVEVVTPEKRVLSMEADELVAPGADGLFGVRPGHTPLLSLISPGVLTIRNAGQPQSFFVSGGFVEAGPSAVRVLADQVEPVGTIDVASAQKRLDEARARLLSMSADDLRFGLESATVKRETARMAAALG